MPETSVIFEAYHFDPGPTTVRVRSERQDVEFKLHGDSVLVYLPPPAACILYLTVTPREFSRVLGEAVSGPEAT